MARLHDVPLVGPGNELQLTIDGRAVPHRDVVAAASDPGAGAVCDRSPGAPAEPLPAQPRLVDL